MQGEHELADLAPRDVVAKAIMRRMQRDRAPAHVARRPALRRRVLGAAGSRRSSRPARSHGVDPVTELIPVAPACHYASGGVAHRPVRPLARARPLRHRRGRLLRRARRQPARLQLAARGAGVLPPDRRGAARRAAALVRAGRRHAVPRAWSTAPSGRELQEVMTAQAGVLRSADGLAEAATPSWPSSPTSRRASVGTDAWETTNLLTISTALGRRRARCARRPAARTGARTSRTATTRDWAGHIDVTPRPDGLGLAFTPRRPAGARSTEAPHERPASPHAVRRSRRRWSTSWPRPGWTRERCYDDVVAAALAEDLPGRRGRHQRGHHPRGRPRRRRLRGPRAGRRGRPGRRRAGLRATCMGDEVEVSDRLPDGTRVAAGDVVMRVAGPVRGLLTAERTALNFACHLSGVATATVPLGRRARGHRAPGCSTPARRCRACGRCRSTPCAAAAASTTGSASPTWRWSRTTTCSPPAAWCRRTTRSARATPTCPVEVEVTDLDQLRELLDGRLRPDPARQHGRPPRWPRRSGSPPAGPGSRPPAGSPSSGPARSPRPASTSSPSARSPTRSPVFDIGMDLAGARHDAALRRHRQQPHRARAARRRRGARPLAGRDRRAPHRRRVGGAAARAAARRTGRRLRRRHRGLRDGARGAARVARDAGRRTTATSRPSSSSPACGPASRC